LTMINILGLAIGASHAKEKKIATSDKATDRFGAVDNEGEKYTVVVKRSKFRRVKRHVLLTGEKVNCFKGWYFPDLRDWQNP
jgi:hypothetical protein